ncbi:MAG: hypothetical protein NTY77_07515 [Elusimicrobia bacterium]|nr:hypothetical protein [Elusimicrobiota bacterium]
MPAQLSGQFEGRVPFVAIELLCRPMNVLVDTGYDGYLMLPQTLIDSLNLTYLADTKYQTADGKVAYGATYLTEIQWLDRKEQIEVDSTQGDIALLGLALLYSCRMEMAPAQGLLTISAVPRQA